MARAVNIVVVDRRRCCAGRDRAGATRPWVRKDIYGQRRHRSGRVFVTRNFARSMGWLPDYPDLRDYTIERDVLAARPRCAGQVDTVAAMLGKLCLGEVEPPASVDLRGWCSPVEDEGALGSCTAQAGVALVEYYERRAFGRHLDASRRFLYKVTRNLLGWTGDTGAFIRTTMGALVLFGVPPEERWPYSEEAFDEEPTAFCYAMADEYQALQYFRLDPPGTPRAALLARVKELIAAGLPSMFGFTAYGCIEEAEAYGRMPFPGPNDITLGGHAVVAVGYDDGVEVENPAPGAMTTGALLIRNSWGEEWGDGGYGWLPYEYVLEGLAIDWWTLLKSEWVDTEEFGL